jgi:folate-binding protein YgfZ
VRAHDVLLLVEATARDAVVRHLSKYAVFQKVSVWDASAELFRLGLYAAPAFPFDAPPDVLRLPAEGELAGELVGPVSSRAAVEAELAGHGSVEVGSDAAEILRVEAGRPRLGQDADETNLPDEVGLQSAVAPDKGCYVGQEVVARLRTYGRVNRRLVGFRFPDAPLTRGAVFPDPVKAGHELGRVTSSVVSPRFGPIGLGLAFRDVPEGATLEGPPGSGARAIVGALPFA